MLSCVVATNYWGRAAARVGNGEGVINAVAHLGSGFFGGGGCEGTGQNHGVEIYPQLADIVVRFADGIGAGIAVRAGRIGTDDGVGVVLRTTAATS